MYMYYVSLQNHVMGIIITTALVLQRHKAIQSHED